MSIQVREVAYGYILTDEKGCLAEPLTRTLCVKYYKTKSAAAKQRLKLLKKQSNEQSLETD